MASAAAAAATAAAAAAASAANNNFFAWDEVSLECAGRVSVPGAHESEDLVLQNESESTKKGQVQRAKTMTVLEIPKIATTLPASSWPITGTSNSAVRPPNSDPARSTPLSTPGSISTSENR
eukprot:CAMPEP_0172195166 /NCGR_PEP_ID=MMETSP1050-20130122/26036_1 /TAXON_ID=233186 /ORGANISM="Cryptomonas curvata, Strain CCAP979/52" /LENGTH=121 /DNA_ID=CAMNT_0012871157 /DNA_START=81 /DNA_END=447 /DNA_ORIENTATION=+